MYENINWDNIDERTAETIYREAQLEKEQTVKSLESSRQKSTILLSICLGLFTLTASKIHSIRSLLYTPLAILLIGLFSAFCFFMGSLWPRKFKSLGSLPSRLLLPDVAEHGVKHLYSCMIISIEPSLERNHRLARSSARCFLAGFITLFITMLFFLVTFLFMDS